MEFGEIRDRIVDVPIAGWVSTPKFGYIDRDVLSSVAPDKWWCNTLKWTKAASFRPLYNSQKPYHSLPIIYKVEKRTLNSTRISHINFCMFRCVSIYCWSWWYLENGGNRFLCNDGKYSTKKSQTCCFKLHHSSCERHSFVLPLSDQKYNKSQIIFFINLSIYKVIYSNNVTSDCTVLCHWNKISIAIFEIFRAS
jgi:hypothetical protein